MKRGLPTLPPKSLAPLGAIFVVLLSLVLVYAVAYLVIGEERHFFNPAVQGKLEMIERKYGNNWIAALFTPASRLESTLRGITVEAVHSDHDEIQLIVP